MDVVRLARKALEDELLSANLPVKRRIAEMVLAGFGSAATFTLGRISSMIFGVTAA